MDEANAPHVDGLDIAVLTPVVRSVLGRDDAEVVSWGSHPLQGGAGGAGIYRVVGEALTDGEAQRWSVIRKVIRVGEHSRVPSDFRYWAREPMAYSSGALEDLAGGLATPRCYGISEVPDQEFALWLEDVEDAKLSWTPADFGAVARLLGRFNAAYLIRGSVPNWPWLSRRFLHTWIEGTGVARNIAAVRDFPDHPRVRSWYPGNMREQVLQLWEERETLLAPLEVFPLTLCHMDAFRRNFLVRRMTTGTDQFVLLDWAFMGRGALGEELVALVSASVVFFCADPSELEELDRACFEGYLEGLADAGWRGDERAVRYAYTVASAMRFGLPVMIDVLDDGSDAVSERNLGRPMHAIVGNTVALRRYLFRLADEARELLPVVQ